MATFLTYGINNAEVDITDTTKHVHIMLPSKDKKCRVSEENCSGT